MNSWRRQELWMYECVSVSECLGDWVSSVGSVVIYAGVRDVGYGMWDVEECIWCGARQGSSFLSSVCE